MEEVLKMKIKEEKWDNIVVWDFFWFFFKVYCIDFSLVILGRCKLSIFSAGIF